MTRGAPTLLNGECWCAGRIANCFYGLVKNDVLTNCQALSPLMALGLFSISVVTNYHRQSIHLPVDFVFSGKPCPYNTRKP